MNGNRKYLLLLGLFFAAYVLVAYYRPQPIDWNPTFSNKDKIPYGTYVLFDLLPGIFPGQPIEQVREPIFNFLENRPAGQAGNFVFVNATFQVDSLSLLSLLRYAGQGNRVFISAEHFAKVLEDTLHFETEVSSYTNQQAVGFTFEGEGLKQEKPFYYAAKFAQTFFEPDSGHQLQVLGRNSQGEANFVQVPFGKGAFYLHSAPIAFTNYHLVSNRDSRYAAMALSHLPAIPVFWDEYQKQGRAGSESKFRVLLQYEPLRWAYYLALAGLILFVVFEGKRTQRIIPIIEKPRNTTLDFVRVVGNLYFNSRDHAVIAGKKINYFLEYLRLHFYENTGELHAEFRERLGGKTGIPSEQIGALLDLVIALRGAERVSESQLINLNKQLEAFYRQAGRS